MAFAILLVTVTAGLTTQGWTTWRVVARAPLGALRGVAAGLLVLAAMALAILTLNARAGFLHAEAQLGVVAQDFAALDRALRDAGDAGQPARITLFRYADQVAHSLPGYHPRHGPGLLSSPGVLEQELRQQVAGLSTAAAEGSGTAAARLELLLRGTGVLASLVPSPGMRWCRAILVAWMMVGLGLLALAAPAGARSAILLVGLAGALSVGLYLLEGMAAPFRGAVHAGHGVLDEMLFALSE